MRLISIDLHTSLLVFSPACRIAPTVNRREQDFFADYQNFASLTPSRKRGSPIGGYIRAVCFRREAER
uniref:Uncharacterized protein n=1 Tax=Candidatus Kentrum sp. TUN TaxID=2126343 RepID=A0A450ZN92_9GAMM|nr:MAG: hypothetical protein BECKTUN1418F_GA0071002_10662 [Candidatus Kentron sp. TUN]VFK55408.1 MAG: hypothetical protein BECKTUN1418E_GA0071001_10297 [Candidatus Kentron sp. TUN]